MVKYRNDLIEAIHNYILAILDDGDWLNDWLTHVPAGLSRLLMLFGQVLANALGF